MLSPMREQRQTESPKRTSQFGPISAHKPADSSVIYASFAPVAGRFLWQDRINPEELVAGWRMKIEIYFEMPLPPAQSLRCGAIFRNNMPCDPEIKLFKPRLRALPNCWVLFHDSCLIDGDGK